MFRSKFFVLCARLLGYSNYKPDRAGERLLSRWHKFQAYSRINKPLEINKVARYNQKRNYNILQKFFKRLKSDIVGENQSDGKIDCSSADNCNKKSSGCCQDSKVKCKKVKESTRCNTSESKCPSPPCPPPCPCPPFSAQSKCNDNFFKSTKDGKPGCEEKAKPQRVRGETILPCNKSYPLENPQPVSCTPTNIEPVKCATPSCPPQQVSEPLECPPPACIPYANPPCPKMEALQFDPSCKSLNFYLLNAPTCICKDEVLVQIVYSGVCDSDVAIIEGKLPCKKGPVTLGHEFSGIACAVGSNVHHVKCGDCIAVNPYSACQVCRYCTEGKEGQCLCEGLNNIIGVHRDGGWAEFVVVNKNQVFKLPPKLPLDQAALLEPLSCVLAGLSKCCLTDAMNILVQGANLAGTLLASVLHYRGFRNVMVCEKDENKRKQFECLKTCFEIKTPDKLDGVCADVVIDCTCESCSIQKGFKTLNPHGQLCIFGQPNPSEEVSISPHLICKKELKIFGSLSNAYNFSNAIDLAEGMGCRYLDCNKLGIQTFQLGQFEGAFQMLKCGEINGILFKVDSSK